MQVTVPRLEFRDWNKGQLVYRFHMHASLPAFSSAFVCNAMDIHFSLHYVHFVYLFLPLCGCVLRMRQKKGQESIGS